MQNLLFQNFGQITNKKEHLLKSLDRFLKSDEFIALAKLFSVNLEKSFGTIKTLDLIKNSLLDEWDYRSKTKVKESSTSKIGARWGISDYQLSNDQSKMAFYVAEKMGISSAVFPLQKKYDIGVALGGAKLSNYLRFNFLIYLQKYSNIEFNKLILLGSTRPLSEIEKDVIQKVVGLNVNDEYEYFKKLAEKEYQEAEIIHQENGEYEYGDSEIVIFKSKHQTPCIAVKAPSSDPKTRRAHTGDTYKFLMEKDIITEGSSVCASTSSIYIPYQQLTAYKFHAKDYNLNVETVGFPPDWNRNEQGLSKAQNYLQEIRSFLNVAYGLVISY